MMNLRRSQFMKFDHRDPEGFSSTKKQRGSIRGRFAMTLQNWRKAVLFVWVVAFCIDPLFFYVLEIDAKNFCVTLNKSLARAVSVIRTGTDMFYLIHIVVHLISRESIVHSDDVRKRTKRLFHFIADIFCILPIPQVVALQRKYQGETWVMSTVCAQYWLRTYRMILLHDEVRRRGSGRVTDTKLVGYAFSCFFLYLWVVYVIGAFWYHSAIIKREICWFQVCAVNLECSARNLRNVTTPIILFCEPDKDNSRFLNTSCPLTDPEEITNSTVFNFGIHYDAFKSQIVEAKPHNFLRKFLYCFWWSLRNMSALGQNLKPSNSAHDIIFAIFICISGMYFFAVLIGHFQKYLQSATISADEMEKKHRDTEKWMSKWKLPRNLKKRIQRHEKYKGQETIDIEEDSLLNSLPGDIRLETERHIHKIMLKDHNYKKMLKRVPWLNIMDDGWLLEALSARMEYTKYSANSYIVREGDSVEKMLIVTKGRLKSMSAYNSNSYDLHVGDTCGELLFWVLDHSSSPLPISDRTITTLTDVEGLIMLPDDLKFVDSHFTRYHNKNLKRMFRFYSWHWRSWAASFVQAAWRKYRKRKHSKNLLAERDNQEIPQGTKLNLGGNLYASRFVSKALRSQREITVDCSSSPHMPPPMLHKPADPEFSKNET